MIRAETLEIASDSIGAAKDVLVGVLVRGGAMSGPTGDDGDEFAAVERGGHGRASCLSASRWSSPIAPSRSRAGTWPGRATPLGRDGGEQHGRRASRAGVANPPALLLPPAPQAPLIAGAPTRRRGSRTQRRFPGCGAMAHRGPLPTPNFLTRWGTRRCNCTGAACPGCQGEAAARGESRVGRLAPGIRATCHATSCPGAAQELPGNSACGAWPSRSRTALPVHPGECRCYRCCYIGGSVSIHDGGSGIQSAPCESFESFKGQSALTCRVPIVKLVPRVRAAAVASFARLPHAGGADSRRAGAGDGIGVDTSREDRPVLAIIMNTEAAPSHVYSLRAGLVPAENAN
ncbi:unnamed protein product [Lampetra planeri]